MNRIRFLAKSSGDNIEGTKAGIRKLLELLKSEEYENVTIVVPKLENLKHSILVDALGEHYSNKLIRDRIINFDDGKKLCLCGQATLKNFKREDAYLGLWATKYMIEDLEQLQTWKGLIIVSWMPEDVDQWQGDHEVNLIYDDGKG